MKMIKNEKKSGLGHEQCITWMEYQKKEKLKECLNGSIISEKLVWQCILSDHIKVPLA